MEEASENAQFMAGSTIPHQIKSLQLQVINYMLEQTVTQKDALLSKLQDEVDTYKFIMKMMQANNNKALTKYEALKEKQNMLEKELRAKSEKVNCMI
ncbi:muscle-specific protein [Lasius niger]|uniref:Muscle-specific protein n=1 Tax=Lasius niger TaxID=67767 RepID=A0A0J7MMD9_LASNI|nr:muscle-specific protein [Lasius niger]